MLLLTLTLWTLPFAALGCGITTHLECGERAATFFEVISDGIDYNQIISRNADAYQAGCSFPDAFYPDICRGGIYHDVAEDTHWTPYIKAAVDYIRRQYPRPWDRDTEKLVVFLLAIIQHQVTDVNWHSLGIDQGFLEAMGQVNYNGSFNAAHSAGDFGGDVLNVYELDLSYVGRVLKWYVPTEDLYNIYTELYGREGVISREVIETCTQLMFLGRLGETLGAIDLLYPLYAANSPFLVDELNGYFLGGIDDMSVWVQNVWRRTIKMLDNGTDQCHLDNNPIWIRCNGESDSSALRDWSSRRRGDQDKESVDKWLSAVIDLVDPDMVTMTYADRGVYFSVDESVAKRLEKKASKSRLAGPIGACDSENVETPTAQYLTRLKYSRLGQHITVGDVNNDGYEDAVISAPGFSPSGNYQQGRVYVVYGGASGVPELRALLENGGASLTLNGFQPAGRFGSAVLVIDMNADGLNDLVVSAPSVGSETLDYFGQVYVYLYGEGSGGGLPTSPSITIDCTERYCNLGWTLSKGDFNGDGHSDVIIGSPYAPGVPGGRQRGMVGVVYSGPHRVSGGKLTQADFDWRWNGEQDYQLAGYSVAFGSTTPGVSWLLVGAPSHRICALPNCVRSVDDVQAAGKAFVFKNPVASPIPFSTILGTATFEQLGAFVSLAEWEGTDVVIITSLTAGVPDADTINGRDLIQAGVVNFYPIRNEVLDLTTPLVTLYGNRDFGRFGGQVIVFSSPENGTSLALASAALRSEDLFDDREGGRVYLFNSEFVADERKPNRVFGLRIPKIRFGSSMAIVKSEEGKKLQLLVGAQHYSPSAPLGLTIDRLVGTVYLVDL